MKASERAYAAAVGLDIGWVFLAPLLVILAAGDLHRFSPLPLLGYWQIFWPVTLVMSLIDGIGTRFRYYWRAGQ